MKNHKNGYYWATLDMMGEKLDPIILEKDDYGWNSMGSEISVDIYYYTILGPVAKFNEESTKNE